MNKYSVRLSLKYYSRTVKELMSVMPMETVINVCIKVMIAGISMVQVYVMAEFIDSVGMCYEIGMVTRKCIQSAVIFALLIVAPTVLQQITYYIDSVCIANKKAVFLERISQNAVNADLVRHYDPEYHNALLLAKKAVNQNGLYVYFNSVMDILPILFRLVGVVGVAASFSMFYIPVALLSVVPSAIAKWISNKEIYLMRHRQAAEERKKAYFWKLLSTKNFAKELRIYNSTQYIREKWTESRDTVLNTEYKVEMESMNRFMMSDLLKSCGLAVGVLISVILARKGIVSVGQFSSCVVAFSALQSAGEQLIKLISDQSRQAGFVEDYYRFMDLPLSLVKQIKTGMESAQLEKPLQSISLENVSFCYPNSNKRVLEEIDLAMKSGNLIVIVGENGSGKTTLSKILLGVFEPCEGEIWTNDDKKSVLSIPYLTKNFSVVQQEFERYLLSVRENVAISDTDRMSDTEGIKHTMVEAGAGGLLDKIDNIDVQVGREFGGVEFSGGEWQRLATSRGVYKDAGFLVFDEPTSAMDVYNEDAMLKQIVRLSRDKATLVISHRVGVCKYADLILVMKDGHIVEKGTHNDLIKENGEYSRLWKEQAKWYVDNWYNTL